MFAVPDVLDSKTPSMNEPLVVPEEVMFTVEAVKVGVTDKLVLINASPVKVKV